jgi:hypothetical protein
MEGKSTVLCGLPSCGKKATSDCASCKTRGYCSKEHQHADWKAHKVDCKRICKARKAAASAESGAAGGGGGDEAAPEGKDAGGAAGGRADMMPEGKDAGDVGGGEEPTPPRHITLRALMEEDAFDINTNEALRAAWVGGSCFCPQHGG